MLSKEVSSTIFKVFGMTRLWIEPRSPGLLADTLLTRPMSQCFFFIVKSYPMLFVAYWPLTEPLIRHTCVNKRKITWSNRKLQTLLNNICRCLQVSWGSWSQWGLSHSQLAVTENAPLGPVKQPRLIRRNIKWDIEDNIACNGQGEDMGQCSDLSCHPPPVCLSHTPQKLQTLTKE